MKTANQGRYASYNRRTSKVAEAQTKNYRGGAYVNGNTVRKLDVVRELEQAPQRRLSNDTRKNREKAQHMNLGYVAFLFFAMCVASAVLIGYLRLLAANTSAVQEISLLESQLNDMKLDNDEEYSRIMSTVDLEQVKKEAIDKLGMQYAQEGQIIEVPAACDDYVRQYKSMP